jgi:hypothetical protein
MYKKTIPKKSTNAFNFRNLLWVSVGFLLFFPLVRFVIRQYNKFGALENDINSENVENTKKAAFIQNQNPIISQNKADKITVRKDVQQAAKKLAHDLGTKYSDKDSWWSWADPRGWTENDKSVADALIYQQKNFALLKKLYYDVYTNSRNLTDDLYTLLDDKELKRVTDKINLN